VNHFRFIFSGIVLLLLLFAGYSIGGEGEDRCKEKGMSIDDKTKKYSMFQVNVSKPVAFNDIACGFIWRNEQCTAIQMTFDNTVKAYDYLTGEEIFLKDAFFVTGSEVETPLGSGLIAFKDRESADNFVHEKGKGKVHSYDDILAEGVGQTH